MSLPQPGGVGPWATAMVAVAPFRTFVLKLHSRCNLACDYCYLYAGPDATWRERAVIASRAVIDQTAVRIAEHVRQHGVSGVSVVLHGGEPMLAGTDLMVHATTAIRAAVPAGIEVDVRMQTNATLLTSAALAVLATHRIGVGVSVDGGREANDRHRRYRGGRGSYDEVAAAIGLLTSDDHDGVFHGVLSTVDLSNDPLATYEALLALAPPRIDFLLPHANWAVPPPGHGQPGRSTPYGDWLVAIFDRWYDEVPQRVSIRMFDEIIRLALGASGRTELLGLSPVDLIVIETDGSMEQVDTLKSTFHGAAHTGLSVFTNRFDDALSHPAVQARQQGVAGLGDTCRACSLREICGGGYYPHRYRGDNGYANASVYCGDLRRLIEHIVRRIHRDLQAVRARPVPSVVGAPA